MRPGFRFPDSKNDLWTPMGPFTGLASGPTAGVTISWWQHASRRASPTNVPTRISGPLPRACSSNIRHRREGGCLCGSHARPLRCRHPLHDVDPAGGSIRRIGGDADLARHLRGTGVLMSRRTQEIGIRMALRGRARRSTACRSGRITASERGRHCRGSGGVARCHSCALEAATWRDPHGPGHIFLGGGAAVGHRFRGELRTCRKSDEDRSNPGTSRGIGFPDRVSVCLSLVASKSSELAVYYSSGKLSEPELTHDFLLTSHEN